MRPCCLPTMDGLASPQEVAAVFGADFASKVTDAPVGQWDGPAAVSGYGLHLVRSSASAGAMPAARPDPAGGRAANGRQNSVARRTSFTRCAPSTACATKAGSDDGCSRRSSTTAGRPPVMGGPSHCGAAGTGAMVPAAQAHEVRPGYLEIREVGTRYVRRALEGAGRGEYRFALYAPAGQVQGEPTARLPGGPHRTVAAAMPRRAGRQRVAIDGLGAMRTDVWPGSIREEPPPRPCVSRRKPARRGERGSGRLEVARTYLCSASSTSCSASITCCSCSGCCSSSAAGGAWSRRSPPSPWPTASRSRRRRSASCTSHRPRSRRRSR